MTSRFDHRSGVAEIAPIFPNLRRVKLSLQRSQHRTIHHDHTAISDSSRPAVDDRHVVDARNSLLQLGRLSREGTLKWPFATGRQERHGLLRTVILDPVPIVMLDKHTQHPGL